MTKDCSYVCTCQTQYAYKTEIFTWSTINPIQFQQTWDISTSMKISYHYSFLLLIIVSISANLNGICRADPTDGFTLLPLTNNNIKLQKPYNEPLDDRYSFDDGVRKLWVYTNDKPYKQGSPTRPRTEVRINVLSSLLLW